MDDKEIIPKYLKEKSNEAEVIELLQKQKKILAVPKNNPDAFGNDYFSLIIKLAKNSAGKIKYHAIIILSNIKACMEAGNFCKLCCIADENLNNKDGNIRQASYILIKSISAFMIVIPFMIKSENKSNAEINLFYESFRNLFYKLYFSLYNTADQKNKKTILKSLKIMLPGFYDMAEFRKDQYEIDMINKIRGELNKHGTGN